ncbi:MAG: LamB/YcsF family protein [Fimbriimonadaceae bacterium]
MRTASTDQSTLVSRKEPDAILTDPSEVCKQAERLANEVDSLCLHGDTPGAVAFADQLFQHLQSAGIEIAPFRPGGR